MHIHCPFYTTEKGNVRRTEQSRIYRVSGFGYERCRVDDPDAFEIGVCRQPFTADVVSIVFRAFSPLPNVPEYWPGQSYYFISTSSGSAEGLDLKSGGLCQSKGMRIRLDILPNDVVGSRRQQPLVVADPKPSAAPPPPPRRRPSAYDGRFPEDQWKKTVSGAMLRRQNDDDSPLLLPRYNYLTKNDLAPSYETENYRPSTKRLSVRGRQHRRRLGGQSLATGALLPILHNAEENIRRNAHLPIKFEIGYEEPQPQGLSSSSSGQTSVFLLSITWTLLASKT